MKRGQQDRRHPHALDHSLSAKLSRLSDLIEEIPEVLKTLLQLLFDPYRPVAHTGERPIPSHTTPGHQRWQHAGNCSARPPSALATISGQLQHAGREPHCKRLRQHSDRNTRRMHDRKADPVRGTACDCPGRQQGLSVMRQIGGCLQLLPLHLTQARRILARRREDFAGIGSWWTPSGHAWQAISFSIHHRR